MDIAAFRAGSPTIHIPARLRKVAQIEFVLEQCFHTDIVHHHKQLFSEIKIIIIIIKTTTTFSILIYMHFSNKFGLIFAVNSSLLRLRRDRFHERRYVEQHPEVLYPLEIHTLFYNHPELARSYALPL
jgi:hypothetical protein